MNSPSLPASPRTRTDCDLSLIQSFRAFTTHCSRNLARDPTSKSSSLPEPSLPSARRPTRGPRRATTRSSAPTRRRAPSTLDHVTTLREQMGYGLNRAFSLSDYKQTGNDFFKLGKFRLAASVYSRGIEAGPDERSNDPLSQSNRHEAQYRSLPSRSPRRGHRPHDARGRRRRRREGQGEGAAAPIAGRGELNTSLPITIDLHRAARPRA